MTNEVVNLQQKSWTPEQMNLIISTIAKGATPDELKLFLYRCQNMGLDPLKPGQIYFIKYGQSPGTIVVGIEGFRARAAKTGKLSGIKRGPIKGSNGELAGAYAEVFRSDWKEPAREEVPLSEYFKPGKNGKSTPWDTMPETMIKKVAEAAALRMAFPDELGGTYIKEEMDQAESRHLVVPEQPAVGDGHQPQEYIVPYGPCAKQAISKADPAKMRAFIIEREEGYRRTGRTPGPWFIEMVKQAEPFIAEYENGIKE